MATNNQSEIISKLYTFKTLFANGVDGKHITRIVIPKIQRAYAQGREEEFLVRDAILKDIFDALKKDKDIEFSFIYGSLVARENGFDFELLDGQQRMTTIFLLYLYLYIREQPNNMGWFQNIFTYETRTTSSDFIHKLVQLKEIVSGENTPSQYIESKVWFTNAYKLDSTVTSMLTMLDSIHRKYESLGCTDLVGKLEHLKFYVLPLDRFGLTEELYIKMNARGLQLTPFENFKADLVGYYKPKGDMKDAKVMAEYDEWLKFATQLDNKWIDLFWCKDDKTDKEFNDKYFRFFYRYCAIMVCVQHHSMKDSTDIDYDDMLNFFESISEEQNSDGENKKYFGFKYYKELIESGVDIKGDVTKILNTSVTRNQYSEIIKPQLISQWGETMTLLGTSASYTRRAAVLNAAIILYILHYNQLEKNNFERWMRVAWNIVENTDIDRAIIQINTIKSLNRILLEANNNDNIYNVLANGFINDSAQAIKEEAIKAKFIVNNPNEDWEGTFKKMEKHPFFKGFVGVVLSEGITFDVLKKRIEKIVGMFDGRGIAENYRENNDHILMRAMLASVNHWDSGLCDLYITEIVDKDKHLKLLLRRDEIRQMLWNVLDSSLDLKEGLEEVIKNRNFDHSDDWLDDKNNNVIPTEDLAYERLCTDVNLANWISDHCSSKKSVKITQDDWRIRVSQHFKIYIDNNLHKYIPRMENEKGFVNGDLKQEECFDDYGYYRGDVVYLNREIGKYNLQVEYYNDETVWFSVIYCNNNQKNKIINKWNVDSENIYEDDKMVYIESCKARNALSKVDNIIAKLETL